MLSGNGQQRGFFVNAGTVTIVNLTIQNTVAQGGFGGGSGGGFVSSVAHYNRHSRRIVVEGTR